MKTRIFGLNGLFLTLSSLVSLSAQADDDFRETLPDNRPPIAIAAAPQVSNTKFSSQPSGSLTGRIVFTSGGHGWTWGDKGWNTQRGVGQEMNEDYGNLDQMNHFVAYAFNAGATVVPMRPVGQQTNEIILDNDSPGVKFSGQWAESRSTIYYGRSNAVPYQFAPLAKNETSTATYTPKIPVAGFYPVYTWARHGIDRTSQLYRIFHTGGEMRVRVPHHMVGSGWVYLGTYYFDKGANPKRGAVVISNLQPTPSIGSVVIADAIRFGNGMGDFIPENGATISTYPREEEASRYWIARSLGQGQSEEIYNGSGNDQSDNVGAPIRLAKEMNRAAEGNIFKRIYISFHSNAGGGRGTEGLWNDPKRYPGAKTPNQERLALLIGREVDELFAAMSSPPLEVPWFRRRNLIYSHNQYAYGEINNRTIEDEFDATILEVAFHDHKEDSKLLRDPKVRNLVGRSAYRAVMRYMNEFDQLPLQFLPEPPQNIRAVAVKSGITVSWDKPESDTTNAPVGYVIYQSENGYGFGNAIGVSGDAQSFTFEAIKSKTPLYFRVTAVNAAGESLPSKVVGCSQINSGGVEKILFVNGFTEFSRFGNPRQFHAKTNYTPINAFGNMDRVIPRRNNAFDYVAPYGKALAANGVGFDSCGREAISSEKIALSDYKAVFWSTGNQRTETLTEAEQKLLSAFRKNGGHVFLSGAHIAEDLNGSFGSGRRFLEKELHILPLGFVSNRGEIGIRRGTIFPWNHRARAFGRGADTLYFVSRSDVFLPNDDKAEVMLRYAGEDIPAAVQIEGEKGEGSLVYFGFPFETISSERARKVIMGDVLEFLF